MTLAVYYPFSQTDWYRASIAYLDLQHQGLVVLMLLLALLMVSNVKYPKLPSIGIRSAKGLFGLAVHLAILIGGILAPEYFLFPLGLFYVAFGLVRATVLGLMERPELAAAVDDQLSDSAMSGDACGNPLPANARPAGATGARSRRSDELSSARARDAARWAAGSPGTGRGACARGTRLRPKPAGVRVGRAIELDVAAASRPRSRGAGAADVPEELLANPVTEDYLLVVEEA